MKDAVDEECKRWLCCVHLGVLIRDAVLHSSYENYANVLKCFKSNSELFPNKSDYKKLVNQLNISVGETPVVSGTPKFATCFFL